MFSSEYISSKEMIFQEMCKSENFIYSFKKYIAYEKYIKMLLKLWFQNSLKSH